MSFSVEGDYFETCNCEVSCPCVWLRPADNDACELMLAWHVDVGQKDGVDLSGLNAVMAVHSPKQMTDGGWKAALYLDDRATPEQSEALGAVFSGGAGGHLAAVAPLIGEVAGVAPAAINLVLLMVRRGRPGAIDRMIARFAELLRRERGIVLAEVRTALPLDDGQRAEIAARLRVLTGEQVEMDETVDPDLIGGVAVRIGDRLYDASVRSRLERLRARLTAV